MVRLATEAHEHDGIEGPVRLCLGCLEEWPDDDEFYRSPRDRLCIACRSERRARYRREAMREASRRYRARRRAVAS
jgi:hypothetical protein